MGADSLCFGQATIEVVAAGPLRIRCEVELSAFHQGVEWASSFIVRSWIWVHQDPATEAAMKLLVGSPEEWIGSSYYDSGASARRAARRSITDQAQAAADQALSQWLSEQDHPTTRVPP